MNKNISVLSALLTTLLLSACSDGTVMSGGGAGDNDADPTAVALITPLVGLYDLPDNWAGIPTSEAYLEIQTPNASGTATTIVYRLDATSNCIEQNPARGEVTKDPFSERVFLDTLDFGLAVILVSDTRLVINLSEDIQDIDADDDFDEPNILQATSLGIMASDLPETCQF